MDKKFFKQAFIKGKQDFKRGLSKEENPFSKTEYHFLGKSWVKGWTLANKMQEKLKKNAH